VPEDLIIIRAKFDPDADVWFVEDSDFPGINAEASTLEALVKKLPAIVEDLVEAAGFEGTERDIAIEVIAHAHTRARLKANEAA
jgi:predicted RNase H-like HicB family nuclease